MSEADATTTRAMEGDAGRPTLHDVIVIGAGLAGLYQLKRLREHGFSVRVLEAGDGVGGTWYWNRYPGARFDSESYSYGYSFSEELLEEWEWQEHFSPQAETLRYAEYVAHRFDLYRDIELGQRVTSAIYDEAAAEWRIETDRGRQARCRFLVTGIGILSAPTLPNIEGMESFRGESHHTARWPHEPVSFEGRRVGVIGTGATGVQVIQEVAKTARHLTVFQRTPNYCAPLGNRPITPEEQRKIKASYPKIFARCRESNGCFIHRSDARSALEVSAEKREAFYEELYGQPGFAIWMGNFYDIIIDRRANDTISEFMRRKIRERVLDPAVAEKLTPRDHGFGTRRVPLETGYYEVYNQDNVTLVDIRETPIRHIEPGGIRTSAELHPLDLIVYATGFDAITGAFDRIDIRGRDGRRLREKWRDGPRTYLGIQSAGFPNLFTLVGPHNAATFCNIPRCIEQHVEWVTDALVYLREHGRRCMEATEAAEDAWTQHVYEMANLTLIPTADSWFMGVNSNLPDKKRTFMAYAGGAPRYRERCDAVAAAAYEGFTIE